MDLYKLCAISDGQEDDIIAILLFLRQKRNTFESTETLLDMNSLTDNEFWILFRLKKTDFHRLLMALAIPEEITLRQRSKFTGKTALLILLRRLAYPNRLIDLKMIFGRTISELSLISNYMIEHIYDRFHNLLESVDQVSCL